MSLFSRKIPSCLSVSAVKTIAVPTTLGVIVKLAMRIPSYIKTFEKYKPEVEKYINMVSKSSQSPTAPELNAAQTPHEDEGGDVVLI